MKILFEKNLLPLVYPLINSKRERFCGSCVAKIDGNTRYCKRCGATIINSWRVQTKEEYITRVTISENEDKLLLNIFENKVYLHNDKFYFTKYIHPFAFNFKSGQSYKLPILNGETKQTLRIKDNGIKNISYTPYEIQTLLPNTQVQQEIVDVFYEKASKYIHYLDEIDKLNNSDLSIKSAICMLSLTKYKYVDANTESIICSNYIACEDSKIGSIRSLWLKPKSKELIEKKLKLKFSKETWGFFDNNLETFAYLYNIGYLKIDNQRKLINAIEKIDDKVVFNDPIRYINPLVDLIKLYDDENAGIKKITTLIELDPAFHYIEITDIWKMLTKVKESDISIKEVLKSKSFHEMHDKAVKLYALLKHINRSIKITEKDLKLNYDKNGVSFTVCTETDQLTKLGQDMHNCVASYADAAVSKRCYIVYGTKDGKLFTCIEIRNNALIQVKGYCNKRLEPDLQKIVRSWAKSRGLKFDKCSDLIKRL